MIQIAKSLLLFYALALPPAFLYSATLSPEEQDPLVLLLLPLFFFLVLARQMRQQNSAGIAYEPGWKRCLLLAFLIGVTLPLVSMVFSLVAALYLHEPLLPAIRGTLMTLVVTGFFASLFGFAFINQFYPDD